MAPVAGPSIMTSRAVAGIVPSTADGNLSWNDDGQCMFISKRTVHIWTPYLTSTLPPPPMLVDPNMTIEYPPALVNKAKRKAEEDTMDVDGDLDDINDPGPSTRVRRSPNGDVRWWNTGIEVDKDGGRNKLYGWSEVGDEYSAVLSDREAFVRAAVWSPSGLSELGGSLIAVMTTFGQVSVYAPRSDPSSKQWDEIADLTMSTRRLIRPKPGDDPVSPRVMLEMKSTCMQWSSALPFASATGNDGSILAVGNRAGLVGLWTYGSKKHFRREVYVQVCDGWVGQMTWSMWRETDEMTCEADLVYACTDGSIRSHSVQNQLSAHSWSMILGEMEVIDQGDGRVVTAMRWIGDILVWTKAGSVSLWVKEKTDSVQWQGIKAIRLERVGSWASANALGACVGIHPFGSDQILIILSSLTQHLITSITTSPTLASLATSLRLSVAVRECFLDYVHEESLRNNRYKMAPKDDNDISAYTGGWAAIGGNGQVASWFVEPINFHNLDSATEGTRFMNFMVADLSSVFETQETVMDGLNRLLTSPPRLDRVSPTRALSPYMMRLLAAPKDQRKIEDVFDLVTSFDAASRANKGDAASSAEAACRQLMNTLWNNPTLDKLRLRLVLARWMASQYEDLKTGFEAAANDLTASIMSHVQTALIEWGTALLRMNPSVSTGSRDGAFLTHLLRRDFNLTEESRASLGDIGGEGCNDTVRNLGSVEEDCLACGEVIPSNPGNIATCTKGHEWARCSITHSVITTSTYRVCSTCPAIALFPTRYVAVPVPVTDEGDDRDHQRFDRVAGEGDGAGRLVDEALEAAVVCVMCGGRWVRAM